MLKAKRFLVFFQKFNKNKKKLDSISMFRYYRQKKSQGGIK